jgi:hypothetical protein
MVALGSFIFWNTNILNKYTTTYDQQARQADYEKKYKALTSDPQPKITAVKLAVDLFPREQRVRMKGHYTLQNRTGKPIDAVHLLFFEPERMRFDQLEFSVPATLATDDPRGGLRSYRLATPLAPGATMELAVDLAVPTRGFTNTGATTNVVANGRSSRHDGAPVHRLSDRGELATDRDRKKFGLAPKERMATATTRSGSPRTRSRPTPTSSTSRRPSAPTPTSCDRARYSSEDRRRPALFRVRWTARSDFFAFQSAL